MYGLLCRINRHYCKWQKHCWASILHLSALVLSADKASRELTLKGTFAYQAIIDHYGSQILNDLEELDRCRIRELIFQILKKKCG